MSQCEVEGCASPAELNRAGKKVCRPHYGRHYRTGSFGEGPVRAQRKACGTCIVEGCSDLDKGAHGYCPKHYTRILRHGDPEGFVDVSERKYPRRESNPKWTGDEASYDAMHSRLRAQRGSVSDYACVDCGKRALNWSYNHRGGVRERREGELLYSISVMDYEPRCVSCHRRFDYKVIPPKSKPINHEYVIGEYLAGRGYSAIGRELGVSSKRVRDVIVAAGIEVRGPGGDQRRVVKAK